MKLVLVQSKCDMEINAWHGRARDALLHARTRNLAAPSIVSRRSGGDGDGNNWTYITNLKPGFQKIFNITKTGSQSGSWKPSDLPSFSL